MITVYFESKWHGEKVAVFDTEELYHACLPVLEKMAKKDRMVVSESYDEEEVLA